MFRRMLKQIQKLPNNERKNTLIQIKSEFHKNKNISDDKDIEKLLNKAESSLGYLKMITPKSKGQSSEPYHRVFGKGSDVPIKKAVTNWTVSYYLKC